MLKILQKCEFSPLLRCLLVRCEQLIQTLGFFSSVPSLPLFVFSLPPSLPIPFLSFPLFSPPHAYLLLPLAPAPSRALAPPSIDPGNCQFSDCPGSLGGGRGTQAKPSQGRLDYALGCFAAQIPRLQWWHKQPSSVQPGNPWVPREHGLPGWEHME